MLKSQTRPAPASIATVFTLGLLHAVCAHPAQASITRFDSRVEFLSNVQNLSFEGFDDQFIDTTDCRSFCVNSRDVINTPDFAVTGSESQSLLIALSGSVVDFGPALPSGERVPWLLTTGSRFSFNTPVNAFALSISGGLFLGMSEGQVNVPIILRTDTGVSFELTDVASLGVQTQFSGFVSDVPFSEVLIEAPGIQDNAISSSFGLDGIYYRVDTLQEVSEKNPAGSLLPIIGMGLLFKSFQGVTRNRRQVWDNADGTHVKR